MGMESGGGLTVKSQQQTSHASNSIIPARSQSGKRLQRSSDNSGPSK